MMIEHDLAEENMRALLTDHVAAPLYHLPLALFQRAVPKLIGEGLLETDEVHAILEYMMRIEELNRGLERARSAAASESLFGVNSEYSRNQEKVRELIDQKQDRFDGETLSDAVAAALSRLDR